MDLSRVQVAARRLAPGRRVAVVLTVLAGLLLLGAVLAFAARFHTFDSPAGLAVAAATPYVLLAAPVGVLLMLVARQWIGLAAGVVVAALCLSSQLWLFTADDPPRHAVRLTVLTSNLLLGEGDAADLVAAVRHHRADLLMVEELTADEQERLKDAGLDDLLPYHASQPQAAAAGTGLWSRYPLTDIRFPTAFAFAMVTARVAVPGVPTPITAVALHMAGPVPDASRWSRDIALLPSFLHALPRDAPVVVGGDFNATPDTTQFRRLLTDGYADSAAQAGAGYLATYPAHHWYPPLIAIDHVLTRGGAVAVAARTISIRGSDHRALLAEIAVPRS